jgi:uncharacterized protein (DUF488 family)
LLNFLDRELPQESAVQATMSDSAKPVVFTIGHSTRSAEDFIALLRENGITCLVDVRTVPRSARNPQCNRETLPATLAPAGIEYVHLGGLGGLRHPRKDSINTAWRTPGFRGYADYMQTPAFEKHLDTLIALIRRQRVALMCAEAVPWRCHRSLLGDALLVRGCDVQDIMGPGKTRPHELTPFARVVGTKITYPGLI